MRRYLSVAEFPKPLAVNVWQMPAKELYDFSSHDDPQVVWEGGER
jgi:hypothetical protein